MHFTLSESPHRLQSSLPSAQAKALPGPTTASRALRSRASSKAASHTTRPRPRSTSVDAPSYTRPSILASAASHDASLHVSTPTPYETQRRRSEDRACATTIPQAQGGKLRAPTSSSEERGHGFVLRGRRGNGLIVAVGLSENTVLERCAGRWEAGEATNSCRGEA